MTRTALALITAATAVLSGCNGGSTTSSSSTTSNSATSSTSSASSTSSPPSAAAEVAPALAAWQAYTRSIPATPTGAFPADVTRYATAEQITAAKEFNTAFWRANPTLAKVARSSEVTATAHPTMTGNALTFDACTRTEQTPTDKSGKTGRTMTTEHAATLHFVKRSGSWLMHSA